MLRGSCLTTRYQQEGVSLLARLKLMTVAESPLVEDDPAASAELPAVEYCAIAVQEDERVTLYASYCCRVYDGLEDVM